MIPQGKTYAILALSIFLFFIPILWPDEFYLNVIISTYLQIILAVSLNMIIKTGKLSIAHAAFMGIGGYTSALAVMRLGLPYLLALPLSGLMGACIAILVGRLLLKLQGVYFVLVTFAFGEVIRLFFVNLVEPFGGPTGIINIPPPKITVFPGTTFTILSKVSYYYLVLLVMLITLFLIQRIYQSSIGKAMDCTRETEHLAEFTGINTFQQKMFAFAAGGFFAGLAGSLFAHYYRYISPESFTFWESVNLIVINVVGGMGGITGPILGSIFLVPLPEFLRGFVEYQRVLYGLILILTLWFMPAGMLGVLNKILDWMKARKPRKEAST
ncbi:MAG: branched-chain amino acid ABC transporter permease [Thermodesulfobacteriota bacterium]